MIIDCFIVFVSAAGDAQHVEWSRKLALEFTC